MNRIGIVAAATVLRSASPLPALLDAADNSLTGEEEEAGWILLFDGRSTSG